MQRDQLARQRDEPQREQRKLANKPVWHAEAVYGGAGRAAPMTSYGLRAPGSATIASAAKREGHKMRKRAIGIIRVSQTNGREGESFASPKDQRDRIKLVCERAGFELLDVLSELDVSGRRPLDQRPGLGPAVQAIETGRADAIVVAYFDRLVRSLKVQSEVVSRVEAAGGDVLTLDIGAITNRSAVQRMTSHFLGAVAQYHTDSTAERSRAAQVRAVARGVLPAPNAPPGLRRGADGVLVKDEDVAPIVAEAFERRAAGESVTQVRAFLAERGVERSYSAVCAMLANRLYVGEIRYGESHRSGRDGKKDPLVNLNAHEAIVDRSVFEKVQRTRASSGRLAKSQRLLPRLGVLRCASCGSRMSLGGGNGYPFYICGRTTADCSKRAAIGAEKVETVVVERVKELLADLHGEASSDGGAAPAALEMERAQQRLDAAVESFSELMAEPSVIKKLGQLREARDQARDHYEESLANSQATSIAVGVGEWKTLTLDEQRALVKATIESVVIEPGRGPERIRITVR
ncbi:MAG: recombinase family protein [Solirubrobacteraceae bacterium]